MQTTLSQLIRDLQRLEKAGHGAAKVYTCHDASGEYSELNYVKMKESNGYEPLDEVGVPLPEGEAYIEISIGNT